MNISYQERNHWICVLISVWALAFYFLKGLSLEGGLNADIDSYLSILLRVIVYSVIAGTILAIANWCFNKEKHVEKDEMDRLIELKGFRNAYWACSGLLWIVIFGALINERAIRDQWESAVKMDTINFMVHSIFVVASVATLVQSFTHIIFYRRGTA